MKKAVQLYKHLRSVASMCGPDGQVGRSVKGVKRAVDKVSGRVCHLVVTSDDAVSRAAQTR